MTSWVVGGVGGSRKIACKRVLTKDFGILLMRESGLMERGKLGGIFCHFGALMGARRVGAV